MSMTVRSEGRHPPPCRTLSTAGSDHSSAPSSPGPMMGNCDSRTRSVQYSTVQYSTVQYNSQHILYFHTLSDYALFDRFQQCMEQLCDPAAPAVWDQLDQVILSCDWSMTRILASDWSMARILTSDWSLDQNTDH